MHHTLFHDRLFMYLRKYLLTLCQFLKIAVNIFFPIIATRAFP